MNSAANHCQEEVIADRLPSPPPINRRLQPTYNDPIRRILCKIAIIVVKLHWRPTARQVLHTQLWIVVLQVQPPEPAEQIVTFSTPPSTPSEFLQTNLTLRASLFSKSLPVTWSSVGVSKLSPPTSNLRCHQSSYQLLCPARPRPAGGGRAR